MILCRINPRSYIILHGYQFAQRAMRSLANSSSKEVIEWLHHIHCEESTDISTE